MPEATSASDSLFIINRVIDLIFLSDLVLQVPNESLPTLAHTCHA